MGIAIVSRTSSELLLSIIILLFI
ncbi:hypothetical protein YPPY34_3556, partial [Yersinia pestis PY-34]